MENNKEGLTFPDIRNKLTPIKNLITMLEYGIVDEDLYTKEVEECKKSLEYLSGVEEIKETKTNLYFVALVYQKPILNGVTTALRILATKASSKEEALGKGILYFQNDMKDFNLAMSDNIEVHEDLKK